MPSGLDCCAASGCVSVWVSLGAGTVGRASAKPCMGLGSCAGSVLGSLGNGETALVGEADESSCLRAASGDFGSPRFVDVGSLIFKF